MGLKATESERINHGLEQWLPINTQFTPHRDVDDHNNQEFGAIMPSMAALADFDDLGVSDPETTQASWSFRLEAAETLGEADLASLDDLIKRAGDSHAGNVFFEPGAVLASARLSKRPVHWLLWSEENRLCFATPVTIFRIAGFSFLKIWTHTYAPLGSPLITKEFQAAPFFEELEKHGFSAMICPHLETHSALAKSASSRKPNMRGHWSGLTERAVLSANWTLEASLSKGRKKKLRKSQRKLPLVHRVLRGTEAQHYGFRQFCDLEAMGWKGAAGSALKQSEIALQFATELVAGHAARGTLAIDSLEDPERQGEKSVAMVISFEQAGRGVFWKIGHNTDYDEVSPGFQLILAASERFTAENKETAIDSLAGPEHPMVGWLWPKRLMIGTLVIPVAGSALTAKGVSLFYQAETRLRTLARALRRRLRG